MGRWIVIGNGRIDNEQAVAPSTGNAGPRDGSGPPGARETALRDRRRLAVVRQPLEIQRAIHSFDPWLACAVRDGAPAVSIEVT